MRNDGCEAEAYSCDVSDREHCFALARHAAECGAVKVVLHIAGMSPHMGDAEKIMQVNALGTVNINDAFFEVIAEGGCVIDTSSTSAYMTPSFIMPKKVYPLACTDRKLFMDKMMKKVCVVTGGGSGIGFAAAKEAAKKGYYVMIVGRNEKNLQVQ